MIRLLSFGNGAPTITTITKNCSAPEPGYS
jgi:hypothetical protein